MKVVVGWFYADSLSVYSLVVYIFSHRKYECMLRCRSAYRKLYRVYIEYFINLYARMRLVCNFNANNTRNTRKQKLRIHKDKAKKIIIYIDAVRAASMQQGSADPCVKFLLSGFFKSLYLRINKTPAVFIFKTARAKILFMTTFFLCFCFRCDDRALLQHIWFRFDFRFA